MISSTDVQTAVDELAASLRRPVLIEDHDHRPLWWSDQYELDDVRMRTILRRTVDPSVAAMVRRLRVRSAKEPMRTPPVPEAGMQARWCVPIRADATLLGFLWVTDASDEITEEDLVPMVACAARAGQVLAHASATDGSRARMRRALLDRLGTNPDDRTLLDLIALEHLESSATVVVQAPAVLGGWELGDAMSAHVDPPDAYRATSGAPVPLSDLRLAVHRAAVTRQALRAGARLASPTWDALGSWRLVVAAPVELAATDVHQAAQALSDLRNPDLLDTARTMLEHGSDVGVVASALHIHRTTLYYRVERIEAITGVDLKGGHDHTDLLMALRLAAYRRAASD